MQIESYINSLLNMLLKDLLNATAIKQLFSSKISQVRILPFALWVLSCLPTVAKQA